MQNTEHDIKNLDKYFITPNFCGNNRKNYYKVIESILDSGIKLIQFRSKNLTEKDYHLVSKNIYKLCREYNAVFFINDIKNFSLNQYCHGIHLTSENLKNLDKKSLSNSYLYAGSCHNISEIEICNNYNLNFIVISPILSTNKKIGFGWEHFKDLAKYSNCPVYALGGLNYERDIDNVIINGGSGVAGISYYYNLFNS